MFDIGFWELVLIAVIGLVVIGPERLPKLAYTIGVWFGKFQRTVRSLRMQLEHEFNTDEFQRMLEKQEAEIRNLKNILTETDEHKAVDDLIGDVKKLNQASRKNHIKKEDESDAGST